MAALDSAPLTQPLNIQFFLPTAKGNDTMIGGNGTETFKGCTGDDDMTGGLGSDNFIIDYPQIGGENLTVAGIESDIIRDFIDGTDIFTIENLLDVDGGGVGLSDLLAVSEVVNDGTGDVKLVIYDDVAHNNMLGEIIFDNIAYDASLPGGGDDINEYVVDPSSIVIAS